MNTNTKIEYRNEVTYLSFNRLSDIDFIKHAFSTKKGGVSEGMFSSMNLSFSRGDNEQCVVENYKRFFNTCGFSINNVVMSDQVHKTDVYAVKKEDIVKLGSDLKGRRLENVDGMVTNLKNVPLITYYADCVPLYFVDTEKKAIGLSHAGWRGTVSGMAKKTVEKMIMEYNTNPKDIIAVIGPSICRKCYEVSEEVIDAIKSNFEGHIDYTVTYDTKNNGKYQLDLWLLNKLILLDVGVLEENIIISDVCTNCNCDLLFSHRATQGKRGNLAAVLEIVG